MYIIYAYLHAYIETQCDSLCTLAWHVELLMLFVRMLLTASEHEAVD